jgi:iron(III) transport system substrate-binding protein
VETFLESLLANNVQIVNGNAAVKNLVASAKPRQSLVCVGVTDTDDVYAGIAAGEPVQMIIPDEEDGGTLVIPSTVCILKNAPHPIEARKLFVYLLSDDTQMQLVGSNPGYQPLGQSKPRGSAYPTGTEILERLLPSSRWTRDNFHSK